jgi:chromosome segregation ATPase
VRIIATLVAVATLVVGSAACGGEPTAEEEWADSVCTDVGAWQDELQQAEDDIRAALQSPGAETLGAIDTAVRQAIDATRELSADVEALEAPDTESGAQAKQQLDDLATQLESLATQAREALDRVAQAADPLQALEDLAALAPELQSAVTAASTTLEAVQASGSDLEQGFEAADSCDQFQSD